MGIYAIEVYAVDNKIKAYRLFDNSDNTTKIVRVGNIKKALELEKIKINNLKIVDNAVKISVGKLAMYRIKDYEQDILESFGTYSNYANYQTSESLETYNIYMSVYVVENLGNLLKCVTPDGEIKYFKDISKIISNGYFITNSNISISKWLKNNYQESIKLIGKIDEYKESKNINEIRLKDNKDIMLNRTRQKIFEQPDGLMFAGLYNETSKEIKEINIYDGVDVINTGCFGYGNVKQIGVLRIPKSVKRIVSNYNVSIKVRDLIIENLCIDSLYSLTEYSIDNLYIANMDYEVFNKLDSIKCNNIRTLKRDVKLKDGDWKYINDNLKLTEPMNVNKIGKSKNSIRVILSNKGIDMYNVKEIGNGSFRLSGNIAELIDHIFPNGVESIETWGINLYNTNEDLKECININLPETLKYYSNGIIIDAINTYSDKKIKTNINVNSKLKLKEKSFSLLNSIINKVTFNNEMESIPEKCIIDAKEIVFNKDVGLLEQYAIVNYNMNRRTIINFKGKVKGFSYNCIIGCAIHTLKVVDLDRIQNCALKNCYIGNLLIDLTTIKEENYYSFIDECMVKRFVIGNTSKINKKIPVDFAHLSCIDKLRIIGNIGLIDNKAFYKNEINELELNEGLKEIGCGAFALNNIKQIEIPSTVIKICINAFSVNNKLSKVDFKYSDKTLFIHNYAFNNCSRNLVINFNNRRVVLSEYAIPDGAKIINARDEMGNRMF